ncbi:YheC/YheD family protein [Alicyclobacillus suci]|uniref:YheC/YheD family protein n=1 Tax=Alicyclobacillus suci TaxID=2816080 RepID=UPI001CB799A7|nr:YheC/YheD family protein [Alicyclobacillus suci]
MFLDKWQMYLALTHDAIQGLRIPYTLLLNQCTATRLEGHSAWYIKPVDTWGGHQIARCEQSGEHSWTLLHQTGRTLYYRRTQALLEHLYMLYHPLTTIVQQAAPVVTWQGRPFDIRVLCQRQSDGWLIAGTLARVAQTNSIVSNIGTGRGEVHQTRDILRELYPKAVKQRRIQNKLKQVSLKICQVLDTYAPFDEVGIDYGLGAEGQVWLFEVNTNDRLGGPSHQLFTQLPDKTVYEQIEARAAERRRQWLSTLLRDLFFT